MARVSALRGRHSVRRLHAHGFLGGAHVSASARRSNLHYAMLLTRRVPLVPGALCGRSVNSSHLATIGFWTYALFSSSTGMTRLVDGPFPAWMITASIAATILTMIPVATVGLNHHLTMQGYFPLMRYSPTLRFTVFGAMSYTVFSVVGLLISLRSVASYVNFTQASIAYSHLGLYAFFTMVIFGSMYYIVPRLVGREWRYASLIKLHFWASAYGIGLM